MKKVISVILSVLMIASLCTVFAFAAEATVEETSEPVVLLADANADGEAVEENGEAVANDDTAEPVLAIAAYDGDATASDATATDSDATSTDAEGGVSNTVKIIVIVAVVVVALAVALILKKKSQNK